jgi:hypothetical protein
MSPDYARQEFEEYLKCGRLEHGRGIVLVRIEIEGPYPPVSPEILKIWG